MRLNSAPNSNGLNSSKQRALLSSIVGTVLFAVTGGAETTIKKVYMIDARTGDILTSFDSNPVN